MAALILTVVACGGANDEGPAEEPPAGEATVEPVAVAEAVTVAVADTALGPILVDAAGQTLYLFTDDKAGESTCLDECTVAWPPLTTAADLLAGVGAEAGLLGMTERPDGTIQVTYNGHPLYYFAEDSGPGETNGQGVADVWYVVSAAGEAIDVGPDESGGGGGPYGY